MFDFLPFQKNNNLTSQSFKPLTYELPIFKLPTIEPWAIKMPAIESLAIKIPIIDPPVSGLLNFAPSTFGLLNIVTPRVETVLDGWTGTYFSNFFVDLNSKVVNVFNEALSNSFRKIDQSFQSTLWANALIEGSKPIRSRGAKTRQALAQWLWSDRYKFEIVNGRSDYFKFVFDKISFNIEIFINSDFLSSYENQKLIENNVLALEGLTWSNVCYKGWENWSIKFLQVGKDLYSKFIKSLPLSLTPEEGNLFSFALATVSQIFTTFQVITKVIYDIIVKVKLSCLGKIYLSQRQIFLLTRVHARQTWRHQYYASVGTLFKTNLVESTIDGWYYPLFSKEHPTRKVVLNYERGKQLYSP